MTWIWSHLSHECNYWYIVCNHYTLYPPGYFVGTSRGTLATQYKECQWTRTPFSVEVKKTLSFPQMMKIDGRINGSISCSDGQMHQTMSPERMTRLQNELTIGYSMVAPQSMEEIADNWGNMSPVQGRKKHSILGRGRKRAKRQYNHVQRSVKQIIVVTPNAKKNSSVIKRVTTTPFID